VVTKDRDFRDSHLLAGSPRRLLVVAPVDLTLPTLVVHGRADRFFPVGNGEALAAQIPGARLLTGTKLSKTMSTNLGKHAFLMSGHAILVESRLNAT
jgi:pimeloyl-ACP methyl ester carboxylesterase